MTLFILNVILLLGREEYHMNNVTLVGRLTQDPEIKELNDGTFRTVINVAVSRDYRNSEGVYDADFIKCVLCLYVYIFL